MQTLKARRTAETIASDCVVTRLRKLSRRVTRLYDEALRPLGLKASQQAVLVAIGSAPDTRIGEVAQRLELAPSSMTRAVTALTKRGWVELTAEGREARVRLTAEGERLLIESYTLWQHAQTQVTDEIEESGLLESLNSALTRAQAAQ